MTPDGTPVLVDSESPENARAAAGISPPATQDVGPDDLFLAASVDDRLAGYAWLRPVAGGDRRVEVAVATEYADVGLRAELARQAAAYAIADGAGRLFVESGEPFSQAGFDLRSDEDRTRYVALTDPAAEQVTTPPARDNARPDSDTTVANRPRETVVSPPPEPADHRDLSGLFAPERVAVVGATDREGTIGRLLLENLDDYSGDVVPVTPRSKSVFGREAPDSLAETSGVDLAVVAVAPEAALDALETAGKLDIENAVVVSAGFEEAGEDGQAYAQRLGQTAERYGMNVVGPNSMGVMSTASGLNASFSPRHPARGTISLVSQSGAFITASLAEATDRGLGFRHVVSVGNKTDLGAVAYLRYLDADPETAVIAAYLEDIEDGEAFVDVAREVTRSTPVVVLKPGKTEEGASAAASHTGSLAGDDTAVETAFERVGVLRADSAGELFDYAAALRSGVPEGDNVGIVTNAGGPGVLATDAVAAEVGELPGLAESTRERLGEMLPSTAAVGNPTDVLGDADIGRFGDAIDAVLSDPNVDVGLVLTTPHPLVDYNELAAVVGRRSRARGTPVITCFMDGDLTADAKRALRRYGVANYDDPSRAASAIQALGRYAELRDRSTAASPGATVNIDEDAIRAVVEKAQEANRTRLGVESFDLLEACGIDVPAWGLAETPEAAAGCMADIDGSVVLKVASPDIAHKVDVGGVRVGVAPSDVEVEAKQLLEDVRSARPDAEIDGVLVQAMVDTESAVETVVGATDSRFGSLVTFGLGGILVEHVGDVAFALAPLDHDRARELIRTIEADSVLDGARGAEPADMDALADALVRLSALVEAAPEIADIDLNPVLAAPDGATAVDLHVELDY